MNILLLTTHMNTGGITSYLLTLTGGLIQVGHHVFVVSSGGDSVAALERLGAKHLTVDIRVKNEAHPKMWLALPCVYALIKRERIDIIHAQTRVTQVMGTLLSALTKVPLLTTCHGFFKPRFFRRLFPCWGKAVIAISQPVVQHLLNDFQLPASQVNFVTNGINVADFPLTNEAQCLQRRQQWRIKSNQVIGIVARLSDVKGIDVLLKAMVEVLPSCPQAQLMIVGEGPEKEFLEKTTDALGLRAHVRFDAIVNRTADILPVFDIFVMPSLQEGLGLSVMEAQAVGIPVIASRVGGLPDLVKEGETGFLVEPSDAKALAAKIVEVLQNPAKAKKMAQAARRHIEEHFSAVGMTRKTLDLYEKYTRC